MPTRREVFFESLLGQQWSPDTLPVEGVAIPAARGMADINDLHFWVDNPRVYDEVHSSGIPPEEISTMQIFEKLSNFPDAVDLRSKIFNAGGQRDAIIVAKDISGETDRFIVYEGNTRLSVFISLFRDAAEGDWTKIKVLMLDLHDLNPELVITYIGDRHLEDEVNRWATHKGARYYWREVTKLISKGINQANACTEVAEKFSKKITKGVVEKNFSVIDFMEKRKINVKAQATQYSYWKEYFTGPKKEALRDHFNNEENLVGNIKSPKINAFDDLIAKKVAGGKALGEVERVSGAGGHAFRTDMINISNFFNSHPKEAKKVLFSLLDEDITLNEASIISIQGGSSDRDYKMIQDFHRKLMDSEILKLRKAVKKYPDLMGMVTEIQSRLDLAYANLTETYKKAKKKRKDS